jgi:hypothetical protein
MIGPRLPWPPWCSMCKDTERLVVVVRFDGQAEARCEPCVEEGLRLIERARADLALPTTSQMWLDHIEVCPSCYGKRTKDPHLLNYIRSRCPTRGV